MRLGAQGREKRILMSEIEDVLPLAEGGGLGAAVETIQNRSEYFALKSTMRKYGEVIFGPIPA
jgi:hypothetical protein